MIDIEISTWLPLPDILICANFNFFKKAVTISIGDATIEIPIKEDNPIEFTKKSIDIINKIEEVVGDVVIDHSKDNKDKAKEIRNVIESLLL
ncbi:MAG: hypothetical protein JHC31_14165 [Sulfurihydrogenibium sp.]|jgi:hypothetical protein|nr:hypothetical protein [Sulfurihydrogenibium sp.]